MIEISSSDADELQKLLEESDTGFNDEGLRNLRQQRGEQPPKPQKELERGSLEHCQWEVLPNGMFVATGKTAPKLIPGSYRVGITEQGRAIFIRHKIMTDHLIDLGNSNSLRVIEGIRKFWTKKAKYHEKGILFKRGVLMWGPAGSGKTATLSLLVNDLIEMGGIVLLVQVPQVATAVLPVLRKIEPDRPLIVVLEDIEEIIGSHGEHQLLGLLDGEHQTDNVVNIATTNFPENLGARIINRPSRFDEVVLIKMPSAQMREEYLFHTLKEDHLKHPVAQWVRDTEGMSIAHLKELVVAVTCLDQKYDDVIERLSKMKTAPRSSMYDTEKKVGFAATPKRLVAATGSSWQAVQEQEREK